MANIKISELNELTEKTLDDYIPIVDTSASETKKISIENLIPTEIPNIENTYSESTSNAYSCDYINNSDSYSNTEVKTNMRWIDEKPIYRKVFNTTSPSTTGSETTIATIGSFDALVNIIANIDLGTYGIVPLPQMFATNNINTLTIDGKTNGNIIMKVDNNIYTNKNVVIVVEYTKTTD